MKYVVIETDDGSGTPMLAPILFPDQITHKTIARVVSSITKVMGAGFCVVKVGNHGRMRAHVEGSSVTLKMEPQEGDSELIEAFMNEAYDQKALLQVNARRSFERRQINGQAERRP